MTRVSRSRWIQLFCTAALFLIIGSCGGSTRGTGGLIVDGRILTSTDTPIAGATVTVLQSGDSATTNANGAFSIETDVEGETGLLIENETIMTQVSVGDIPSDTESVTVTVRINEQSNTAEEPEVEIQKRGDSSNSGSMNGGSQGSDDDDSESSNEDSGSSGDDDSTDDDDSEDSSGSDSGGSDDNGEDDPSSDDSSDSGDDSDGDDDESDGPDDDDSDDNEDEDIRVEGVIQAITDTTITVSGTTFTVTSETELERDDVEDPTLSDFSVGEEVRIDGNRIGDSVTAEEIRLRD